MVDSMLYKKSDDSIERNRKYLRLTIILFCLFFFIKFFLQLQFFLILFITLISYNYYHKTFLQFISILFPFFVFFSSTTILSRYIVQYLGYRATSIIITICQIYNWVDGSAKLSLRVLFSLSDLGSLILRVLLNNSSQKILMFYYIALPIGIHVSAVKLQYNYVPWLFLFFYSVLYPINSEMQ